MKFTWITADSHPMHVSWHPLSGDLLKWNGKRTLFQYTKHEMDFKLNHSDNYPVIFNCCRGLFIICTRSKYNPNWHSYADYCYVELVYSFLLLKGLE